MLIVISGLPGTGKSGVAAALATQLDAVHLSVDHIEDALLGAGLPRSRETGIAAYEAVRAAAEQNLALGRTVIVDAVNDSEDARATWRTAAAHTGTRAVFVLLRLDDQDEHRRRLEGRVRDLANVPEPTWQDVQERAAAYEPWDETCLQVNATGSVEEVIRAVLDGLP